MSGSIGLAVRHRPDVRHLLCAGALVLVALISAGCDTKSETSSEAGDTPQPKIMRVGFANEAPFAYIDLAADRLTGEAPEVARVVLARMGYDEIEGVLTEFGSLIPGLKAGRFDMIAAGMYITPPRCREVAFSEPSYSLGGAFLVREGNPKGLHGYEDVREDPEVRLGVMAGAVETGYARAVGIADAQLVQFPDPPSALAAVRADRIDAFAGTALTVEDLLRKAASTELERADPFTDPLIDGETVRGYGAFVFRKDDIARRDAFDAELASFLSTPEHLALVTPFGFTASERPGSVTRQSLCADEAG